MTSEDRQVVAQALWGSVERLVPGRALPALQELRDALEATYNAHGDGRVIEAREAVLAEVQAVVESERVDAYRAGMLAVKKRSDYRDLDDIKDPEELRSTH